MTLPAQDIVERLRKADANSQQRTLGSRIFGEAADIISRLIADNEALRDALSLANQRGDAWKNRAEAAEARADALAQEVERLRLPEGTLAKHGSTITIEFDNAEYALRAFDAIEYAMSREPAALANEEAGR